MSKFVAPTIKREAARLRKRRERERRRQKALEVARALAEHRERSHEDLAPAAMRRPVMDQAGNLLIGARVQIVNGRPVRANGLPDRDVVKNLARNSPMIGERHHVAARQLQCDFDDVGAGVNATATDYGRVGGCGERVGPSRAILGQIQARRRLEGAMAALGPCVSGIARVVLDSVPVAAWAREAGLEFTAALAQIVVGLDKLAQFYWPPIEHPIHGGIRAASVVVSGMAA